MIQIAPVSIPTAYSKRRSLILDVFIRLLKEKPLGTVGLVIVLILLIAGIFANFVAPYGEYELTGNNMVAPSSTYWFGTDNLGRDLFSRIIYGARVSLITGFAGAGISLFISLVLGALGGYVGGITDLLIQRFVDAWNVFPGLVILLIILSITGPGTVPLVIAVGLGGIGGSRTIRSVVMGIRGNVYFDAAQATGSSVFMIMIRHVVPNIMSTLIILFSLRMPGAIMEIASLSFLGFGLPPPIPSWGGMLSGAARTYMFLAPWMAIFPGLVLTITIWGINMFGDALRDLLDPRLRGGVGRYSGVGLSPKLLKKIKSMKRPDIQTTWQKEVDQNKL